MSSFSTAYFVRDTSKLAEHLSGIDFAKLFKHFQSVQKAHHEYRNNQRKRSFSITGRHN